MNGPSLGRLEQLALDDPVLAPLARLQAEALRVAADPVWSEWVPDLADRRLDASRPLLDGQTTRIDPRLVRELLERLATIAEQSGGSGGGDVRRALASGALDPLELLSASIDQNAARFEQLASGTGLEAERLATFAHLAALPLLLACGRQAAPLVEELDFRRGYCPVCAAWPLLAELRGLERRTWLRCGRCGSAWSTDLQLCVFCDGRDHQQQRYLAAEEARDSRRVFACDACQGYLKQIATLGPIPPLELGWQDLLTVELDVAALELGYRRPEQPGSSLALALEPLPRRGLWRAWRR